jgi:hypothetical protein
VEADLEVDVASEVSAQHLDRYVAAKPQVTATVNLGHTAVAQQLKNLIPAAQEPSLRHLQIVPNSTRRRATSNVTSTTTVAACR